MNSELIRRFPDPVEILMDQQIWQVLTIAVLIAVGIQILIKSESSPNDCREEG